MFDKIIHRLILLAVAIAIVASVTVRAHGATLSAADCLKPAPVHHAHRHHKALPVTPIASCAAPTPLLLAPVPALEPIPEAQIVTRYQTIDPAPIAPPAPADWGYAPTYSAFWGFSGMGMVDFGVPTFIRYAYTISNTANTTNVSNTYHTTTNVNDSTTTNTYNSVVNNSTVTNTSSVVNNSTVNNSITITPPPPHHHDRDAHKAPELDAGGVGGALTLLGGLLLVARGRHHG